MKNVNQRDDALKVVAEDAAWVGEADLVKQALGKLTDMNLKDEAARACALQLSAADEDHAAIDVAKTMMNPSKREEALQRIAQGDPKGRAALRTFERTPSEKELNKLQRSGDKNWDLGWVYTVIAGVLNILVMYDAFAGPAFAQAERMHETKT